MADILPPINTPAVALTGPNAGRMDGAYYGAINRTLVKIVAQVSTLNSVVRAISDPGGNLIASASLQTDATEIRAIQAIQGSGFTVRDPGGNWYGRTLTNSASITWTGGDGSANPVASVVDAYITEVAQDGVAAALAAGTQTGISFTYSDAGNSLSATVTATSFVPTLLSADFFVTANNQALFTLPIEIGTYVLDLAGDLVEVA